MGEIFKLFGTIGINNQAANKALDETEAKGKRTAGRLSSFFTKLAGNLSRLSLFRPMTEEALHFSKKALRALALVATAVTGFSFKAAGDMQAMNAQFAQVFGEFETQAQRTVSAIAKQTNILPNRLKPAFTSMAAFAKTAGMDTVEALSLSERATVAAADSAAFHDKSIQEVTESLQSYLKGNYANDAALGISSTETTRNAAANKLYGQSFKDLSEAQKQLVLLQMVEDGNRLSGALGQAAREGRGMENVLGNLKQGALDLAAAFGSPLLEPLLSAMERVTQGMTQLAAVFRENPALVYAVIGAVTTLSAALGTMYVAANAKRWLDGLRLTFVGAGKAAGLFTNPIGWVVVALGALVTAFIYFYQSSETFRIGADRFAATVKDKLVKGFEALSHVLSEVMPTLKEAGSFVKDKLVKGFEALSHALSEVMPTLKEAGSFVKDKLSVGLQFAGDTLEKLGGTFGKVGGGLSVIVSLFTKIGLAALGINGPLGLIIAVLVSFLGMWVKTGDLSAEGITKVFAQITDTIANAADLIARYAPLIVAALTGILVTIIEQMTAYLPQMIDVIITLITILAETFAAYFPMLVTGIVSALPLLIEAGVKLFTFLLGALVELLPLLIGLAIQIVLTLLHGVIQFLPLLIETGKQVLTALIEGVISILPALIDAAITIILALIQALLDNLPQILEAGMHLLLALIEGIISILPALIDAAITIILALVGALIEALPQLISAGVKLLWALIAGIVSVLPELFNVLVVAWQGIKAAIGVIVEGLIREVVAFFVGLKNSLSNVFQAIRKFASTVWRGIWQVLASIVNSIVTAVVQLFTGMRNTIANLWEGVRTAIANVVNGVKHTVSNVWGGLVGSVADIFNGVRRAAEEPMNAVKDFIKGVVDKIKGLFQFSLKFPEIKLPQFRIKNGSINPLDWIKNGPPTLEFFAKGGILTRPTFFGMNGINPMIGGEAGPEAVAPIDTLMGYVEAAVRRAMEEQTEGDIHVTNYITSPEPLTERETARQMKLALQDIAALRK